MVDATVNRRPRRVVATAAVGLCLVSACSSAGEKGSTTQQSTPSSLATTAPASIGFPVGVSANHRFLVDESGKPFLVVGDSPQCLSAKLSTADMEFFFADRQAHGFNTAWVNLLCGEYTKGKSDARTFDDIPPFTKPGDLSTPNPAYFARMDTMVELAAQHGITLLLDPAETGSFLDLLRDNGVDKTEAYGSFLGSRYKAAKNIIWMLGNDYQPEKWEQYDPFETALSKGIRRSDPAKLQTVELNYQESTSYDDPVWPPLIDIATSYTYFPTYDSVLKAFNATPTQPVIMIEANYETENNTGGPRTTDETLRRQEYWTMLSGATGQLYGAGGTWGFTDEDWKKDFVTPAVDQLGIMAAFFRARDWQELVPDQSHSFVTDGYGDYGTTGDVLDNDYATAAITSGGSLAVVYVPTARTIEVDVSKLKQGTTAKWFDPSNGAFRDAAEPYTSPGKNNAGDHDWVLVFEGPGGSASTG